MPSEPFAIRFTHPMTILEKSEAYIQGIALKGFLRG